MASLLRELVFLFLILVTALSGVASWVGAARDDGPGSGDISLSSDDSRSSSMSGAVVAGNKAGECSGNVWSWPVGGPVKMEVGVAGKMENV